MRIKIFTTEKRCVVATSYVDANLDLRIRIDCLKSMDVFQYLRLGRKSANNIGVKHLQARLIVEEPSLDNYQPSLCSNQLEKFG